MPTIEYHNMTWTWLDLLLAVKSRIKDSLLSQAIKQKLSLRHRVDVRAVGMVTSASAVTSTASAASNPGRPSFFIVDCIFLCYELLSKFDRSFIKKFIRITPMRKITRVKKI